MNLSDRIQELRKTKGMSQEELADRVVTMYQGRVNAQFQKADINQDNLTAAAFGIVKQEAKEA